MVRREENSVGETDWEREPLGQEGRRQEPGAGTGWVSEGVR